MHKGGVANSTPPLLCSYVRVNRAGLLLNAGDDPVALAVEAYHDGTPDRDV